MFKCPKTGTIYDLPVADQFISSQVKLRFNNVRKPCRDR